MRGETRRPCAGCKPTFPGRVQEATENARAALSEAREALDVLAAQLRTVGLLAEGHMEVLRETGTRPECRRYPLPVPANVVRLERRVPPAA